MMPTQIPIARYRFHFKVKSDLKLPDYAGSTLRGAFGGALRYVSCMTKQLTCAGCPLIPTCPYTRIFETYPSGEHQLQKFSQLPNPYVIEPPSWGEKNYAPNEWLSFDMVLIGQAISQLPIIVFAWQRAFARGVGKHDGTAELMAVELINEQNEPLLVYAPQDGISQVQPHTAELQLPKWQETNHVSLKIQTPLRLQDNGHALSAQKITTAKLLNALVRRTYLLLEVHCSYYALPDRDYFHALNLKARNIDIDVSQLSWQDWTRYSSRQQQRMILGGVVGDLFLAGDLMSFMPYIWLGQWLHIGKNATFGLGKYTTSLSVNI